MLISSYQKKAAENEAGRSLVFALFFGLNQADVEEAGIFFMNNKIPCLYRKAVSICSNQGTRELPYRES